ncbi:hypothetical protein M514_26163 [Trichuris suis]|uniref:Uncharacterized protein n=1 Tax=Trichuris suis TaxID=68888 RepID=A0A085MWP8_9BILA|nr:hypothetical protein M514_26163 [Trichuris suis]
MVIFNAGTMISDYPVAAEFPKLAVAGSEGDETVRSPCQQLRWKNLGILPSVEELAEEQFVHRYPA